ncbi:hypothetical protein N9L68_05555 [bacterium]|nr:hypothetical protein [bacterium]
MADGLLNGCQPRRREDAAYSGDEDLPAYSEEGVPGHISSKCLTSQRMRSSTSSTSKKARCSNHRRRPRIRRGRRIRARDDSISVTGGDVSCGLMLAGWRSTIKVLTTV